MKLLFGILLICIGTGMGFLTYINVVKKKKFTMSGGGYNLAIFANILLTTGISLVKSA
jgi:hypothetical protein